MRKYISESAGPTPEKAGEALAVALRSGADVTQETPEVEGSRCNPLHVFVFVLCP